MSSAVRILKDKFGECARGSCERPKCKLKLSNFPSEKIILDIDCIEEQKLAQIQGKKCDCIIVVEQGGSTFLVPVEFKTKWVIANDVKKQLEGGIRFFAQFYQAQFEFYPVLVSKKLSRPASKKLKKILINYKSKKARIRHITCNNSLSWNQVKNQA